MRRVRSRGSPWLLLNNVQSDTASLNAAQYLFLNNVHDRAMQSAGWTTMIGGQTHVARTATISKDDMLALVLDAAEACAREDGLRGIVMRRLAAAIGYSAGTIYNLVGDLDEVVARLN